MPDTTLVKTDWTIFPNETGQSIESVTPISGTKSLKLQAQAIFTGTPKYKVYTVNNPAALAELSNGQEYYEQWFSFVIGGAPTEKVDLNATVFLRANFPVQATTKSMERGLTGLCSLKTVPASSDYIFLIALGGARKHDTLGNTSVSKNRAMGSIAVPVTLADIDDGTLKIGVRLYLKNTVNGVHVAMAYNLNNTSWLEVCSDLDEWNILGLNAVTGEPGFTLDTAATGPSYTMPAGAYIITDGIRMESSTASPFGTPAPLTYPIVESFEAW